MLKLTQYIVYDILRNKVIIAYTLFLLIISILLFTLESSNSKALLSILNIQLITVPLVSLIFSTIHYYNSYEFIELILTQPISRSRVLICEYLGVCISLIMAYVIGIGIPVFLFTSVAQGVSLISTGLLISITCVSIAFLTSIHFRDKAKGIGFVLLICFYLTVIYDGIILLTLFTLSDYPMEKLTLVLAALNPIDLARISVMLSMDVSALMGYTGALYKDFFGSGQGLLYTYGLLLFWIGIPLLFTIRFFRKKDF